MKKTVMQALAVGYQATALVTLARKGDDAGLKKEIVQRLSVMTSRIASDYPLEILK